MGWTKEFLVDTAERAVKTFSQSLVGVFVGKVTVMTVDWKGALIAAGTAAAVSVLTSLASSRVGEPDSASLVK